LPGGSEGGSSRARDGTACAPRRTPCGDPVQHPGPARGRGARARRLRRHRRARHRIAEPGRRARDVRGERPARPGADHAEPRGVRRKRWLYYPLVKGRSRGRKAGGPALRHHPARSAVCDRVARRGRRGRSRGAGARRRGGARARGTPRAAGECRFARADAPGQGRRQRPRVLRRIPSGRAGGSMGGARQRIAIYPGSFDR